MGEMVQVFIVPPGARDNLEPLGTKPKFWFKGEDGAERLFKETTPNTGEDWSETLLANCVGCLGCLTSTMSLPYGPVHNIQQLFAKIPEDRITPVAVEFALKMLELNQQRLLALLKELK